jgi:hypothetical protein
MLGMLSAAANVDRVSVPGPCLSQEHQRHRPRAYPCSVSCCRGQRNGLRLIGATYRLTPFALSNPSDRRRAGP